MECPDGHLLVLAGPGSGKTFVITRRIAYLIRNAGISPEQILVITFTREAALSMENRSIGSFPDSSGVIFGTFHSVFYSMLRQSRPDHILTLLTPAKKRKLILDVLSGDTSLSGPLSKEALHQAAEEFPKAMAAAKNLCDIKKGEDCMSRPFRPAFSAWMKAYDRKREEQKLLDYDDMVTDFLQLLREDPSVRKKWQGKFQQILIDEFQDINPAQYEVIRLLAPPEGTANVFAVGDDDQSIYRFRGSEPECLRRYGEDYGAERVYLTENYRSLPAIIQAANHVIAGNKDRFEKEMQSARTGQESGICKAEHFTSGPEQYAYLEQALREAMKKKHSIGVLFRTNLSMQAAASYLSGKGIRFCMKESVSCIYDLNCLQTLMSYLKVAEGFGNLDDHYRIINRPLRYINREALVGEGDPLNNAEHYYQSRTDIKHRTARISNLNQLRADLNFLKHHSIYLSLRYLLTKMHLEEEFLKENPFTSPEDLKQILNWFLEDSRGITSLGEWMEIQKSYREALQKNRDSGSDIALMTVHASKGLEFDEVFLPDCNEGMYPHGRMPDHPTLEEERRIFYVAMTRARNELQILYLTGSRDRPKQKSRFLEGLFPEQEGA